MVTKTKIEHEDLPGKFETPVKLMVTKTPFLFQVRINMFETPVKFDISV